MSAVDEVTVDSVASVVLSDSDGIDSTLSFFVKSVAETSVIDTGVLLPLSLTPDEPTA